MVKVLVAGWDGASKRFLDRFDTPFYDSLAYSGKLLPEKVYRGIPIDSGTAWTTITTGLEVDEHGFLSINSVVRSQKFLRLTKKFTQDIPSRRLKTYSFYGPNKLLNLKDRTPRSTDVEHKRLWDYIDGRTLTLGVPLTYPAWEHNGVLLSGIPAPLEGDMPEAYPLEYNEYRKKYNGYYYIDKQWPLEKDSRPNLEEYKESVYECNEGAFQVVRELANEEFELIFTIFPLLDDLVHALDSEDEIDEIEDAYQWMDRKTEKLVDEIDPDHVVIISDHGMKPAEESLNISHGAGMRMDHDSTDGIWASDVDLNIKEQKDVVPAILSIFDKEFTRERMEMNVIEKKDSSSEKDFSEEDEKEVKDRLKNLGYVSD